MHFDFSFSICRFFAEQAIYLDAALVLLSTALAVTKLIRWRTAIIAGVAWLSLTAIASLLVFRCAP